MLGITKEVAQCGRVCSFAQSRGEFLVSQVPGDGSKRGEVVALGGRWNKKKKNEIDRLGVNRVEMNWPVEPREHTEETIEPFNSGVRQSETFAKPSGP
jgi:hypothetical protein